MGSNPEKGVVQGVFDSEDHAAEAAAELTMAW